MPGEHEGQQEHFDRMHAQDWRALHKQLLKWATEDRRIPEPAARELIAETILRAMDPSRSPWNGKVPPELIEHLQGVFRSVRSTLAKTAARRATTAAGDDLPHRWEPARGGHDPRLDADPEQLALQRERARRVRAVAQAKLAGNSLALDVLDLVERRIVDAEEQARALGVSPATVYRARKAAHDAMREAVQESSDPEIRAAAEPREETP